jgi:UDP-N-acetylglucosamine--N-acetylmuramyl-(pentapeptide) pyrophosphoryl-undecaprenol N-acetylglucosamine transferase
MKKKILLTGGGTGGSVTPLLAVAESLGRDNYEFIFVGTRDGVERGMVKEADIRYKWIHAGKLRRYFSLQNFVDIIVILIGFFESLALLVDEKPKVMISAGSFVSVPLAWAAWFLNIPVLIHQMDIRPGLANRLMAPCARKITTVFEKSVDDYCKKAEWVGNPTQPSIVNLQGSDNEICKKFNLKQKLPIVLVVGGGTGAVGLNDLVYDSVSELVKFCQVVHSTGKGKIDRSCKCENYHAYEYIEHSDLLKLLPRASLVISRAGVGALMDIASSKRPAIIIPMPDSHQEDNANYFAKKEAGIVLDQEKVTKEEFITTVKDVVKSKEMQEKLSKNVEKVIKRRANDRILEIIKKL